MVTRLPKIMRIALQTKRIEQQKHITTNGEHTTKTMKMKANAYSIKPKSTKCNMRITLDTGLTAEPNKQNIHFIEKSTSTMHIATNAGVTDEPIQKQCTWHPKTQKGKPHIHQLPVPNTTKTKHVAANPRRRNHSQSRGRRTSHRYGHQRWKALLSHTCENLH